MFGIADADDVRKYDSSINKLENDQKDIMRIVQGQISILKSTIINFNDSVTSFDENKKLFDANMKEGETKLNEKIIEISNEDRKINILSFISLIENTIFELDMFIKFIDLYKSYPCLWQIKSKEYHDRQLRETAYKVLVEKLKESESEETKDIVVKKINNLRSSVRKEKNKYESSLKSGA
ncbi:hypothetical protein QTP88_008222 [Uroleucon formosanum]